MRRLPSGRSRGRTGSGLFAERIALSGVPDASNFRTFVQARHIYSFVQIGALGWSGPWRQLVEETTDTLLNRARRSDGLFVHGLDSEANHSDARADLYDQAFVLFALGTAGGALEEQSYFDEAEALLDALEARWAHAFGGFHEGEIVDPRIRRQNPHMHLLEAFLALDEASGRRRFREAAHEIANLAVQKFIDPTTGALLEYFTDDLEPAKGVEGQIIEPGHCFEWAWLFERLACSGREDAVLTSDGLTDFARWVTTSLGVSQSTRFSPAANYATARLDCGRRPSVSRRRSRVSNGWGTRRKRKKSLMPHKACKSTWKFRSQAFGATSFIRTAHGSTNMLREAPSITLAVPTLN